MKCKDKKATIYHTSDGIEPTEKSNVYYHPIVVCQTTLIRFTVFKKGLLPSVPVFLEMKKLKFVNYTNYDNKFNFVPDLQYKYDHAHVKDEFELDKLDSLETE